MRLFCFGIALSLAAVNSWSQVVIESFDEAGQLSFNEVTNAASYSVEWASTLAGPWTNFTSAAAALDSIQATGSGTVTSSVPMLYRVVASVTNSNPPEGMSPIPAGAIQMGDHGAAARANELPVHTVFTSSFYMDKFEVTNEEMREVLQYALDNGLVGSTIATVINFVEATFVTLAQR